MKRGKGGWQGGSRDRHEHGGASMRPDDEALARRTERERVDAGLEDYDPNDVPLATDTPQLEEGELYPLSGRHPFPPT